VTLVDSNILIDIWSSDPQWLEWSTTAFEVSLGRGDVFVNPIILAELSLGFSSKDQLHKAVQQSNLVILDLPGEAAYPAGKAYKLYRKRGGTKSATLPDFFIGAHAWVADLTLLTRAPAGYRSYFPDLKLITP